MTCRSGTRNDLNQVFVGYLVKMQVTSNKQGLCIARANAIRWSELGKHRSALLTSLISALISGPWYKPPITGRGTLGCQCWIYCRP